MSDARESHSQAVSVALLGIENNQNHIREVLGVIEGTIGSIRYAVGNSVMESATNAINYTAGARQQLEEAIGMLEAASQELTRYAGGF